MQSPTPEPQTRYAYEDDSQAPLSLPPLPRARKVVSEAFAWMGLILLFLWLAGKVLNDRWMLTQYLWWLPSLGVAFVGLDCVFTHWRLTRKHQTIRLGRWKVVSMRVLLALCLLHAAWELRPHRLLFPVRGTQPREQTLRVLHWNVSLPKAPDIVAHLATINADVVLLANPAFRPSPREVADALSSITPTTLIQGGRLVALSREPVLRWGWTTLRVTGSPARAFTWTGGGMVAIDQGEALILELDTTKRLGTTTVVWLVDLPSTHTIPRARMMQQAHQRLTAPDLDFKDLTAPTLALPTDATAIRARLARPDLVIGDMNTTRGSFSLSLLAPGCTDAFSQAGEGWDRTFPGSFPVLAINNSLVGDALRATKYEIVPLGHTRHRGQVVELESRRN